MGADVPKQFLSLNGKEIISYTIETFASCFFIDKIIIVCHADYMEHCKDLFSATDKIVFTAGGATRQESVLCGLRIASDCKYVLVHDAVRCLVSKDEITSLYNTLLEKGSCSLAVRVKDTIKSSDENNQVITTVPRENLWQIQTPQAFLTSELMDAHNYAKEVGFQGTDDCSIMENINKPIILVEGRYENIKITTPSDLEIAKVFLKGRL
jgi:2-C-methyl-D-erythritol 4-phosphate cytidylyltransferase